MENVFTYISVTTFIFYLVFAVLLASRLGRLVLTIQPALIYTGFWSLSPHSDLRADYVFVGIWLGSLLFFGRDRNLLGSQRPSIATIISITALPITTAVVAPILPPTIVVYSILIYIIMLLMVTEVIIRSTHGTIRAMTIGLGTLFLFQLYLYSQTIVAIADHPELIGARNLLNAAISTLLILTPLYIKHERKPTRKVGVSRPVAFTTTSLLIAGVIITFTALVSLLLDFQLVESPQMIQMFLVFLAILLIAFNFGSSSQRARIRVWTDKHFFQTKHDYNKEWKTLSDRLSMANTENYAQVALDATMTIYNGTIGVLFVKSGRRFAPYITSPAELAVDSFDAEGQAEFVDRASAEWIFVNGVAIPSLTRSFDYVPHEISSISDQLLIIPLIRNQDLFGLIVFSPDELHLRDFDWEDLDLLKVVAKQVSNFVAFQILSEESAVKQQFEAFHQFTTFVMHDLKNLIAQQELVVENAKRFKHKPEFVADAIATIESSVSRMNRMVMKISNHKVSDDNLEATKVLDLQTVLKDVMSRVGRRSPKPELSAPTAHLPVLANQESLSMAITHLVTNAQDACEERGKVKIDLSQSECGGFVLCQIQDTGIGMGADFMKNRLFRPFDSTKKTVGMGIGAYQSKEIISKIGGSLNVNSTLGVGSCFTITLPSVVA